MYYFNNFQKQKPEKETTEEIQTVDLLENKREVPEVKEKIVTNPPIKQILIPKRDTKGEEDWGDVLEVINKITDEIHSRDDQQKLYVERLAKLRGLDPQPLLDHGCFYSISPHYMEEVFQDLNLFRSRYHVTTASNTMWKGRFIIPLRDFQGKVYGFVGYDKTSEAKYVEYSSPVYKKVAIKALGLNRVEDLINSRYCIITEGSMDYFRGIQNGLPMLANLGIKFNKLLKPLLDRMDIVFTAYDNDKAGISNRETIKKMLPNKAYNIIFKQEGIDLDDALKEEKNTIKLKSEIQKRLRFKGVKGKDIYI